MNKNFKVNLVTEPPVKIFRSKEVLEFTTKIYLKDYFHCYYTIAVFCDTLLANEHNFSLHDIRYFSLTFANNLEYPIYAYVEKRYNKRTISHE